MDELGLDHIDLLKLDVEEQAEEYEVLVAVRRGWSGVRAIAGELHPGAHPLHAGRVLRPPPTDFEDRRRPVQRRVVAVQGRSAP